MKTRITILCENTVEIPFGIIGEHGFACLIETDQGSYLFDTGQGMGIVPNALMLGKDLKQIQAIMISHGHYDHTGGLPGVLKIKGPVDVYGHPGIFYDRFWSKEGARRYVGIPYRRPFLESLGARFQLSKEMTTVGPGVYLTGEIPRTTAFEKSDPNMTVYPPEASPIHPDPIDDDLSLVIDSDKGLILILGCAHAGMVNIIHYVLEQMGRDRIYAIIGGTHLGFSGQDQFDETLRVIEQFQIERIGVSHCTGLAKAAVMYNRLGDRFFFGSVGAVLEG
jgi:7,8-dihydropterin-6-yl-methyl-4-(beta-D-ribofuranosyl)aminobenzene 5'-phosphate synthase